MTDTSRRKLIAAAGAGTVAGAVALTPGVAFARGTRARQTEATQTEATPGSATDSVVAYVEDHRSDTLRLMVGEHEVVVRDRDLVARILNAAGSTNRTGN